MQITFDQICPLPLVSEPGISSSEVWLQNCNFERGKKYLIKAPSGKGKSTFFHILMGLRKDYEGDLKMDEKAVEKWDAEDWLALRREQLALVFQDLRLFPQLTALENIQLKAALSDSKSKEDIVAMSRLLGVDHLLDRKVQFLSYGQQQRIAIIRALSQPFSMLLLDEPFSHLDDQNIAQAIQLINTACAQQGAGLIMASLEADDSFEYDQVFRL